MLVPGLGELGEEDALGWLYSPDIAIGVLGGKLCSIVLEEYAADPEKEAFHIAIANVLDCPQIILKEAERYIYQYYLDAVSLMESNDDGYVSIGTATEVWAHIRLCEEALVTRRVFGDHGIYASLICDCGWEPEHGLQIVLRNGNQLCKIGKFDGHLTNADAFDDERLEQVVYIGR